MFRVLLRIYRRTDYDLLSIILSDKKFLKKAMKEALVAYANNEAYLINIPENIVRTISEEITSQKFEFVLNEKEPREARAVLLLRKLRLKKRNDFIKNLVRGYFCGPIVSSYFANDEDKGDAIKLEETFRELTDVSVNIETEKKKKARKPADAGKKSVIPVKKPKKEPQSKHPKVMEEDIEEEEIEIPSPLEKVKKSAKPSSPQKSSRFNINTSTAVKLEQTEEENNEETNYMDQINKMLEQF